MRKWPKKIRPPILLLVFVLVVAVGLHLISSHNNSKPAVLADSVKRHHKQVRSYVHRKTKALCGQPRRGYARCLADATLSDSGSLLTGSPAVVSGYGPTQFHTAYNLPCQPSGSVASTCSTPGSFGPQTIAIVDAGNLTTGGGTVASSLQTYDQQFGLPACTAANSCLNVVNQSGNTSPLPSSAGSSWDLEIALDVETAHMICQTCKIVLVEANSAAVTDLSAANVTAATFNPVSISNSWGGSDASSLDNDFKHTGVATVAATGDDGALTSGQAWPADIPQVVSVAGSTLNINVDNSWASETVWADSGGGCAVNYAAPSWQSSLSNWNTAGCGSDRAFGDVSADGDPNTGAAVNMSGTWYQVGGTSLASPLIASVYALVGSVPTNTSASAIPYSSISSNFHDITSGSDCTVGGQQHCTAGANFDTPSGVGSPNGLGGFALLPTQPANLTTKVTDPTDIHLSWSASAATAGISTYHIYRNGALIGSTSTTSYDDSGLVANTAYTYHVIAEDASSNLSTASPDAAVTTYYPEDINQDQHVDLLDFSLLVNKYGQHGAGVGRADINGDGNVDLLDFSLLVNNYGSE